MDRQVLAIVQSKSPVDWKIQQVMNRRHYHLTTLETLRTAVERESDALAEKDLLDIMQHDIAYHKQSLADIADVLAGLESERSVKQLEFDFD